LEFLLRSIRERRIQIRIFDDGSTDARVVKFLDGLPGEILQYRNQPRKGPGSTREGAARIGLQRKNAIDTFLSSSDCEYCMLLDDDILTTEASILDLIGDFEFLKETSYSRPGAMTLYGLARRGSQFRVGNKVFCNYRFTGEAHIVFSRDSLLQTGNHFGAGEKEFADIQIQRMLSSGYSYLSRIYPSYQVQHLGFGKEGSIIHLTQSVPPRWARAPYSEVWKFSSGFLRVSGFDVEWYTRIVEEYGGERAPLIYLGENNASEETIQTRG
jgi:hypothetical protein